MKKHELAEDGKFLDLDMAVYIDEVESFKTNYNTLKDAVQWMFEAMDTTHAIVSYTSDKSAARGLNGAESLGNIRENARKAVEELLK